MTQHIAPTWTSSDGRAILHNDDCLRVMRGLAENSVDSVVTDPPAGISFMNRSWDGDRGGRDAWIAWMCERAESALRVVKPGGHALVWSLPRTSHWTAMAWEDAGWVPRDRLAHIFGSGFPKSLDIGKAIDKEAGAEREVVGVRTFADGTSARRTAGSAGVPGSGAAGQATITAPATELAKQWDGWGTALKPAVEDWWLFRKPLEKGLTVAQNVTRWGTGAINVGASRVEASDGVPKFTHRQEKSENCYGDGMNGSNRTGEIDKTTGRWPANLVLSYPCDEIDEAGQPLPNPVKDEVLRGFPETTSGKMAAGQKRNASKGGGGYHGNFPDEATAEETYGDSGSAARFFKHCPYTEADYEVMRYLYCPKESDREIRPAEDFPLWGEKHEAIANKHPTLKPLALMQWLVKLVTPPDGLILDPFAGSATTGVAARSEGFRFIGCESDIEHGYFQMAVERLSSSAKDSGA